MEILQHRIAKALQDHVFCKALLKHRVCDECADLVMGVHTGPPELLYYDMKHELARQLTRTNPSGRLVRSTERCQPFVSDQRIPWRCQRGNNAPTLPAGSGTAGERLGKPRNSLRKDKQHLSQCTKMSELRDDLKGSRGSIDGFSNQVDECR
jgi:hypothetical protein